MKVTEIVCVVFLVTLLGIFCFDTYTKYKVRQSTIELNKAMQDSLESKSNDN